MKTHEHDIVWTNENEFLKIESNGKPNCQVLSFILENNKARFKQVMQISKTELPQYLDNKKYKPTNKILVLI